LDDGALALAELQSAAALPDLILLDINMAGLSGFDVLRAVKSDGRLRHIPVVMLTSSALDSDVARAYELGASGYISKPSYLHDVRAVLGNTLLYWSAMQRATKGKATA
jgi:CheY-like chemotaxis protein